MGSNFDYVVLLRLLYGFENVKSFCKCSVPSLINDDYCCAMTKYLLFANCDVACRDDFDFGSYIAKNKKGGGGGLFD